MKEIQLTQGKVALVDDAEYEELSQFKWYANKIRYTYYAGRKVTVDGKSKTILMHRAIMGNKAIGLQVDHRDGNGLNNQRGNLRACTNAENHLNQRLSRANKTGYKGVTEPASQRGRINRYRAQIVANGKHISIGHYPTIELAHAAYCVVAKKLHGDFVRLATAHDKPRVGHERPHALTNELALI